MLEIPLAVSPRRLLRLLVAIAVVLTVVSFVLAFAHHELDSDRARQARRWFDVDREAAIPAWFSSSLIMLSAVALVALHRHLAPERRSRYWLVLAAVLLVMSADEAVAIHEEVSEELDGRLDLGGPLAFSWVIPAAVIVVVLAVASRNAFRMLPRSTARSMILGAVLYVCGALLFELVDATLSESDVAQLVPAAQASVEELLEMLGIIVFFCAVVAYLATPPRQPDECGPGTQ